MPFVTSRLLEQQKNERGIFLMSGQFTDRVETQKTGVKETLSEDGTFKAVIL